MREIGNVVVATRGGVPVRLNDVAEVKIGRELRTGSASENGQEVVVGTALMLIGGNSRTVSAAVDAKMQVISKSLPPSVEAKTVCTLLVDATGMVQGKINANLMSLGALDFGLIVDGAVIIAENSLRHLAERQNEIGRQLNLEERSAEEMIKPFVYGQAIIILVYVPLVTFHGSGTHRYKRTSS